MSKRALHFALCFCTLVILGCAATASRFRPPKVASKTSLEYPLSAQLDKIEGEVMVGVFVDTEGKPQDVRILESSGYGVLDTAAYRFAQTITFDPAVVDGDKISSWTKLVLRYKLSEVPFERYRWLQDVLSFQNAIASATDPAAKANFQQKLYMRYVGLTTYVDRNDALDINSAINDAVTKESRQRWADFNGVITMPFLVFDDFLYRYPDSPVAKKVKEDLIRLLIDAEGDVRLLAFKAGRVSEKLQSLLDQIEKRLDELQRADYDKLLESFSRR